MKGHCKIEVFKDNKLQKIIEKDNQITDAINQVLNSPFYNYFECNNTTKINPLTTYSPIYTNLIGGLFMFNSIRDENPNRDTMVTPQDLNSYIGSCGGPFTGTTDKIKGSLNQNESGVVFDSNNKANGYRYVWDFGTGKSFNFRSLSLTSLNAANAGLSWDNVNDTTTKGEVFGKYNQKLDGNANSLSVRNSNNLTNVPNIASSEGDICYISDDFKILIVGTLANNSYTLTKYNFRDSIKLTDNFGATTGVMSDYQNWEKDLIYSITPTSAILVATHRIIWEGDYIYSISPSWNNTTKILTINYVKINANTMEIELEHIFTIDSLTQFSASNFTYVICGNKLLLNDGDYDKLYIINLDTYTLENTMSYTTLNSNVMNIIKFNNDIVALMMTGSASSYMYMIDLVNMKMYLQKLSGTNFSNIDGIHQKCLKRIGNSPIFVGKSSDGVDYLNVNLFEGFIASILNLDEDIAKAEDETLKITYTITN